MKEARLLKILVEEKALVRLLKTLGTERGYPTRELLTKLGSYGYGHKQLLKAQKRGLVARKSVKNRVFNSLTEDGKKLVKLAREIGVERLTSFPIYFLFILIKIILEIDITYI